MRMLPEKTLMFGISDLWRISLWRDQPSLRWLTSGEVEDDGTYQEERKSRSKQKPVWQDQIAEV